MKIGKESHIGLEYDYALGALVHEITPPFRAAKN